MLSAAQAAPVPRPALDEVVAAVWPGAAVHEVAPLAGGLSSVLHRVGLSGAPVGAVVLRQLLLEFGAAPVVVHREVAALATAGTGGLPVPDVHWSDPEGATLGRPAMLLDLVPGRPLIAELSGDSGRRAMAGALHVLAGIDGSTTPHLRHLDDLEAVLRHLPPPERSDVVDVAAIRDAVTAMADAFTPGTSMVHMDLHGGNVLWDGIAVTGVLDWPAAAVGNPLVDEAYLWLDTCLAHGQDVGDALQRTVDELRTGPAPSTAERRLWRGVALERGLPTPRPWAEAYRAMGVEIDDETVEARFVALVDEYLEED